MLIDINLRRITYNLRICNRYCVSYRLPSQRLPHSFHRRRVQAFNITRSRPFFSFLRNLPKVAEKKPEVLQKTDDDRKDGGDLQASEQKFAKEVDQRTSLDLSSEELTVAESRGNNEQRLLSTTSTVQAPSEPGSYSERPNDTVSRDIMKDTEAVNNELGNSSETLLSIIEEPPDLESLSNSLSHDLPSEGTVSNLDTLTEDPAPLLVAETGRTKTSTKSEAAATIHTECIAVVNDLIEVEEPTASSRTERNLGEGGFCSGGVMNAPGAAINEAGVSHTNIEPVKHTLARHRSDGYSAVQDQPLANVIDSLDIPPQSRSKGLVFENFTQHKGPMSLSSLNQIPESAMQEPSTADGGEKRNVIYDLNKPSTGPVTRPKLIVKALVQEGVSQAVIKEMEPQTEKKLDSSLKGSVEYHATDSSHLPAIARLEAETESYATVTEPFLAASSYAPNGPDSKDESPLSLPQPRLLSWEELINSSKTSAKHYLDMLDAYSLFLACRHTIPSTITSTRIIENELGSLAFRTLLNNASKATLIRSLMLLRESGVFAALDQAALLFPGLFNQADVDAIDARRLVIGGSISEPTEEQFKIHEDVAIAGTQNSTTTTPSRTGLTSDQTQMTELRTVINAHVHTQEDSTTSSLADSMKARLDVIIRSLHAAKVPINSLTPFTPTPTINLPAVDYLAPWENFAQILGHELLDKDDAYSLYLFFRGRPLNVRNRNLIINHSHCPELQAIIQNKGPAIAAISLHVLRHYYVFQYAERLETLFPGAAGPQGGVFRQNDESMSKLQRNASSRRSPDVVARPINISNWDSEAYANTLRSTEAFRIFTIFKNKPLEMVKPGVLIARYQNYPPLRDLVHKTYNRNQACRALGILIALQVFDYPERVAIMFPGAICDTEPIPHEDFLLPVSAIIHTPVKKIDQEDTTAFYESKIDPIEPGVLSNTGNSEEKIAAKSTGTVFRDGTITRKRCINGTAITTFSDKELSEKTGIETAASTMSIDEDTEDLSELSVAKQDWTMGATKGLDRMLPDMTKTAAIFQSHGSPQTTENVMKNTKNWSLDDELVDDEILREVRKMTLKARPREASSFALSELKYYVTRRIAEHSRETDISKRRLITIGLERASQFIPRLKKIVNASSRNALREAQHDWREHNKTATSKIQLKFTLDDLRRRLKKIRATVVSENRRSTIGERSELAQLEEEIRLKKKELKDLFLKIDPRVVVENRDVQSNGSRGAEDPATPEAGNHAEDINGHDFFSGQVKIDNREATMILDAEDDAAHHSANATESVVKYANVPFTIQHMLLGSIVDDFKREIFRYGTLHFPDLLQKVGWDCAESVGISHFQKMVTQGRLPSQQRPPIYLDSNHFLSFVEELNSLRSIRNAYAHETAFHAVSVKQMVADMINLSKAFDAPHLTSKMRRFHEDLVAFLDQSDVTREQAFATLHSRVQEIQAARSRLDQEENKAQKHFALELEHSRREHSRQLHRHVIESLESRLADIRSQNKLDEIGKEVDDVAGPTVWRKPGLRRPAISRSSHHSAKRSPQPNATSLKMPEIKGGPDKLQSSASQKIQTKRATPTTPQYVELTEAEAGNSGVPKLASSIIQQSEFGFFAPNETSDEVLTSVSKQPLDSDQAYSSTKFALVNYTSLSPSIQRRSRTVSPHPLAARLAAGNSIAEHSLHLSHDNDLGKPTTQDNLSSSSGSPQSSLTPQPPSLRRAPPRPSYRRTLAPHRLFRKIIDGLSVEHNISATSTEPASDVKTIYK